VQRRLGDAVLASQIGRLGPGLLLPQNPDDLFFREPTCLHVYPPAGDGLYSFLEELAGLRSLPIRIGPLWEYDETSPSEVQN
jgi:hypothetical protein